MKTSMFSKRKKQGFTLIEIIIVVVILGILAAIALPKLFENLDKARAAEAFNVGSDLAKAFDRCLADESGGARAPNAADTANCNTLAKLNVTDPSTGSSNFSFSMTSAAASTSVRVLATMRAALGGVAGTDIVDFTYNAVTGATTKGCGGKFAKMCKA